MADPLDRVRELFDTDHYTHGCAESILIALQEHYGLPDADDSTPAMAFNGGVAYRGGTCGAITGAALAVGRLAGERAPDHSTAKKVSRRLIQRLMNDFQEHYGTLDCRALTGYDMVRDHEAFLEDGTWRQSCTAQLQFSIERLAPLVGIETWDATVAELLDGPEIPRPPNG